MPDRSGGYDVRLTVASPSFDRELKLVEGRDGQPRLQLADTPDEPGSVGSTGTLKFDHLHHGLGSQIEPEGDRVIESDGLSTLKPGRIEALGNTYQVPDSVAAYDTGATETTRLFATALQWQGTILFILPKFVRVYIYPSPSWGTIAVAGANENFRGPGTFFQGQWWWGLEDDDGLSIGHCRYDTDLGTVVVESAAGDNKASLFHSAHAALWAVQVTTVDAKKGEVGWKLKLTTAADPILADAWEDQTVELFNPYPNAIYQFGRWILIFGADGQVLAVSETPPSKTLIPPGILAVDDPEFGVFARQFGEFLIIPHKNGMHAIPFTDNRLRDFHPQNLQGRLISDIIRPACLTPFGMDYLVGTRSETASPYKTRLLALRRYPEGIFYTQLYNREFMDAGAHVLRAIEVVPETGRIAMLHGNASEGRITLANLPPSTGGRPSSALLGGVQGLVPVGTLETAALRTRSGGRAFFTAVRGWCEDFVHTGSFVVQISVDGGAYQTMSNVGSVAGAPFRDGLANLIGRTVSLKIVATINADNSTEWPTVLTPLLLDYIEEPEGGFRIHMDVKLSTGQRRAGIMTAAWETDLASLEALIGAQGTLKILERQTTYNVLIEGVSAITQKGLSGREASSAAARVIMKVT